jgi:archaellum component FlaC
VQTLKKKVQEMEKELKRLKQLVDEEKTDELIKNLQKGEGGGQGINEEELEQMKEEIEKVESEVNEAKKFKISNKD